MEDETNDEIIDSTNDTEETEQPEQSTEEETLETEDEVDIAQMQATNKRLFERAKKAEAELKALRGEKRPVQAKKPASQESSIEEVVLLANGMDEELLEQLKKISKVQGTSLLKTQADPIFVAVKEKFEKDRKEQQASLGASRGSGQIKPKLDFKSKGLTEEQHREMFEAKFNR